MTVIEIVSIRSVKWRP